MTSASTALVVSAHVSRASLSWLVDPGERHAGFVLALLVFAAAGASYAGKIGPVVLALLSVYWLLVNGSMEGATLFTLSPSHGVTQGDLGGIAGLVSAVILETFTWMRPSRRDPVPRPRRRTGQPPPDGLR